MKWHTVPGPHGRLFEGPHWIPEARVFQWVDILAATLHRWDPYNNEAAETRETGLEFATVALPLDHDRILVASRSSLHVYSWSESTMITVGEWKFPHDVRFNDGALTPCGDIYVGTMSMDRRPLGASLYKFDLAASVLEPVFTGVGISNGLSWDTDTSAFYVDSLVPQIDRVNKTEHGLTREPWLRLDEDDEPDGLAVAPSGHVVAALWGRGCLVVGATSPRKFVTATVPDAYPTSVAFGGVDDELVLVTTAGQSAATDRKARVFVGDAAELVSGS
ncbi:hypothetical protein NPS01_34480 [Nocardioides psychrotolerans]|nr:SMP-30/gluconolactonase/LRE family protein [Nocardioides psychrotolerans]GEP39785.1 hypothetical protein NPS01_34480 [Nocardioides psychrotolerans]